jgi:acyl carrier protein
MDNLLLQVQYIFRDVLDDPRLELSNDSNALTVDGWDSLAHINIVSAVEHEFGVHFTLGELEELQTVGQMLELIRAKRKVPVIN